MADTFTPEQISQILEEFFKVVGTRQYIGARYVPIFGRKGEESIEWDNSAPYEPLTIVLYQGNSYTSRQFVPVGVEITNQEFWAITGNYNAQIEQYRRETAAVREVADNALNVANAAQADINTLLPKADFSEENTVKKYIDDKVAEAREAADAAQADIDTLLPKSAFSTENTVKKYVDDSVADAIMESKENEFKFFVDYKGRIAAYDSVRNFQGGCMLQDDAAIVTLAPPDNYTGELLTHIYELDLTDNGSISAEYDRDWGHCNDVTYNEVNDYIYVVRRKTTTDRAILRCNRFNYRVEAEIDTPVILLGTSFDRKTNKQYIYGSNPNDTTIREVYEFDYTTNTFNLITTFTSNDILASVRLASAQTLGGTQGMACYDGDIYILYSNNNGSLVRIDIETDGVNTYSVFNMSNVVSIYPITEYEICDFDEFGNLFTGGVSTLPYGNEKYGVIGFVNVYGGFIPQFHSNTETISLLNRYNIHVDTSLDSNYQLYQVGESSSMFATANESLKLASVTTRNIRAHSEFNIANASSQPILFNLRIEGDGKNNTNVILNTSNINVYGNFSATNCTLTFNQSCTIWGNATFYSIDIIFNATSAITFVSHTYFRSLKIYYNSTARYQMRFLGTVMMYQVDIEILSTLASRSVATMLSYVTMNTINVEYEGSGTDNIFSCSGGSGVVVLAGTNTIPSDAFLQLGRLLTA